MKIPEYLRFTRFIIFVLFIVGCNGDEAPPKIGFQNDVSQVQEGSDLTVPFNFALPSGVTPEITFSGTATEGVDYVWSVSSNGLVFTVNNDGTYDPDETVIVTLAGFNKGAALGTKIQHTITITETPLVLEFQTVSANRIEGQSIVVGFTKQLPDALTLNYRIIGTADSNNDYIATLNSNGFLVNLKTDQIYDNAETVIIELTGISGKASLGEKKTFTINVSDEDESAQPGLKIDLTWEALDLATSDVDMDLLVWLETSPGVYTSQGGLWSANIGTASESTFIPSNEVDGKYALSYVYYYGTSNNLKVKVDFRSFKGNIGDVSNRASFNKNYTSANINTYSDPYTQPLVVAQNFSKVSNNYLNFSDVLVASSGSRTGPLTFILDEKAKKLIESKIKLREQGGR